MMGTSSSPAYTRGRSLPRPPSTYDNNDMDINNTYSYNRSPASSRSRTPSPVKRYTASPTASPPLPSRSGSTYSHPPLSPSSLGDIKSAKRSSVSYLRNLSDFAKDAEDSVYGLGIPELEREEVPGTAGRKRLAGGETQKVYAGGKLWVDKQRQVIQTYEYLCHVGEAKQ